MRLIEKMEFGPLEAGLRSSPGANLVRADLASDIEVRSSRFTSCALGDTSSPSLQVVSDVMAVRCTFRRSVAYNVLFRDVEVRDFLGGALNLLSHCAFENVVLRGKIKGIFAQPLGFAVTQRDEARVREIDLRIRAHYESLATFAFDVSRVGSMVDVTLASVPGHLVVLGDGDCTLTVEQARRIGAMHETALETYQPLALGYHARQLLMAPWLGSLALLRERGPKALEGLGDAMRRAAADGLITEGGGYAAR